MTDEANQLLQRLRPSDVLEEISEGIWRGKYSSFLYSHRDAGVLRSTFVNRAMVNEFHMRTEEILYADFCGDFGVDHFDDEA
jgi:hypothetical protein